jgi:hypothetical protein
MDVQQSHNEFWKEVSEEGGHSRNRCDDEVQRDVVKLHNTKN